MRICTDYQWFDIDYEPAVAPTEVSFRDHSERWLVKLEFPEGQGDGCVFVAEDQLP